MIITNTKDIATRRVSAVIYGDSGIGKTSLAKTLTGKTLIISAEAGLLALQNVDIDVIEIKSFNEVREVFGYINKPEIKELYTNIFIDSISEISTRLITQLKTEYPNKKDGLVLWGEYADRMTALIKAFRDLPDYNIFLIAQETIDKDENNIRFKKPSLNGKIGNQLPYYFDLVLAMTKLDIEGEKSRVLLTDGFEEYTAKDRSGKLSKIEKPDLQNVLNKILGETK